jgi:hypothetical protein
MNNGLDRKKSYVVCVVIWRIIDEGLSYRKGIGIKET